MSYKGGPLSRTKDTLHPRVLMKCWVKNNPFFVVVKISETIYDSLIYDFYNCMQLAHHTALVSYVKKLLLDNSFLL